MRCSCVANVLLMCRTLLHCQNTCVSSIPCNVYDKFHQKKTRKQKAESIVLPKYLFCVQSHVMCVTKSIPPLSTFRLSLLSQPLDSPSSLNLSSFSITAKTASNIAKTRFVYVISVYLLAKIYSLTRACARGLS
jgi:hypothetical protein